MRLLPDDQRADLLSEICSYVSENTEFQLPDCDLHVQVIPGETEGLYGWIAANYLLGGFDSPGQHDHGKGHHTYGFLDMGGASAQIAFVPNATETQKHAEDLKLLRLRKIDGGAEEYRVFVTTWLGFGANEARRRYVEALESSTAPSVHELPDPCLPSGLNVTDSGGAIQSDSDEALGIKPHLLGTGNFEECMRTTYPLLEKNKPCLDSPCLINGQHVPAIDFDVNHFVGVSEYWHTTHEVFSMGKNADADVEDYDFHVYQDRVRDFCSQPWADIQRGVREEKWGKKVDEQTAREVCFKASWLINMLHEGIGIPRLGIEGHNATKAAAAKEKEKMKGYLDPFQAVNKIKDTEVSWTLGKMVLYASSQIPPPKEGADVNDEVGGFLPVGFGSNLPGVEMPKDFQTPGGRDFALPDDLSDEQVGVEEGGESGDWHDVLFKDSPRRIPGFLLLMLIVCVAVYFLCGRERRKAWASRVPFLRRRRAGRFGSPILATAASARLQGAGSRWADRIFRRREKEYERVHTGDLEEAGEWELQDPSHFDDLGSARNSDDTEGASSSRAGKTPGWATPTINALGGESSGSPSKRAAGAYFGGNGIHAHGHAHGHDGLGVGGAVLSPGMEFGGGLVSRTESRERLTPNLGRSRAGSPFRMGSRSPNVGFKDS